MSSKDESTRNLWTKNMPHVSHLLWPSFMFVNLSCRALFNTIKYIIIRVLLSFFFIFSFISHLIKKTTLGVWFFIKIRYFSKIKLFFQCFLKNVLSDQRWGILDTLNWHWVKMEIMNSFIYLFIYNWGQLQLPNVHVSRWSCTEHLNSPQDKAKN